MIEFTEAARERILAFFAEEEGTGLAVRVSVQNPSPVAPEYEMSVIELEEIEECDERHSVDGFDLVVDSESARILQNTRIDWVESIEGSGFKFDNPNIKPLGLEPLAGPLVERVQRVIDEHINPAAATHGGAVRLVDIRDGIVYLQMGGGCQGCGMASVTLTQGIKQVFMKLVPEIVDIQDVTDHAAGTDPYFSPEK
ncbi:MAG: NifU family protein [Gemmatimonadota bacterium]